MTPRELLIRALFYPTLVYNLVMCRVLGARRWYDRIDEHVVLGALPFASTARELRELGVKGVVNTCAEYGGPVAAYADLGMSQLHIPTIDFTPPDLADIEQAVAFIEGHAGRGESVYVHCKAGRGRSATVVLCWLLKTRDLSPAAAQAFIIGRRAHINRSLEERQVVREFFERYGHLARDRARSD